MGRVRARGEDVRRYLIEHIDKNPADISKRASAHFGVTRQAIHKHLQKLVGEKIVMPTGNTRSRVYKLCPLTEWSGRYNIDQNLGEDVAWRRDVAPVLGAMPENVKDIWHYGFTEMFNNALDHSGGTLITVSVAKTAASTEISILDNGVGIFKKIQNALGLLDPRHAVVELAKGKFTTDPARHSGEGIFFTSRMFDDFQILSGGVFFTHKFGAREDWILEASGRTGTYVRMLLHNHTARTTKKVFDQFTSGDDFGFNKTVVPVELAQYGDDKLVSRSQAKRLLSRVELFKVVVFDFTKVATIGQAFADEIFRVFPQQHRNIEIHAVNANSAVKRMIDRVGAGSGPEVASTQTTLPGMDLAANDDHAPPDESNDT